MSRVIRVREKYCANADDSPTLSRRLTAADSDESNCDSQYPPEADPRQFNCDLGHSAVTFRICKWQSQHMLDSEVNPLADLPS